MRGLDSCRRQEAERAPVATFRPPRHLGGYNNGYLQAV